MQEPTPKKTCPKCKLEMDAQWICPMCNSKRSTLSKMFNRWPIEPFLDLSDDMQVQFWRQDNEGCRTKKGLADSLTISITQLRSHQEINRKGGKFLPLSVLERMGYKTDKIKTNCPSLWDAELEEHTYKLSVVEVVEEKIKNDVVELLNGLRNQTLRGKLSHYCSPNAKRKRSKSTSSSKSSSSSDSSEDEKSKKLKAAAKAKAEATKVAEAKKAEKKQAADQAKAERRQMQTDQAAAKKRASQRMAQERAAKREEEKQQKLNAKQERLLACTTTHCATKRLRPLW